MTGMKSRMVPFLPAIFDDRTEGNDQNRHFNTIPVIPKECHFMSFQCSNDHGMNGMTTNDGIFSSRTKIVGMTLERWNGIQMTRMTFNWRNDIVNIGWHRPGFQDLFHFNMVWLHKINNWFVHFIRMRCTETVPPVPSVGRRANCPTLGAQRLSRAISRALWHSNEDNRYSRMRVWLVVPDDKQPPQRRHHAPTWHPRRVLLQVNLHRDGGTFKTIPTPIPVRQQILLNQNLAWLGCTGVEFPDLPTNQSTPTNQIKTR